MSLFRRILTDEFPVEHQNWVGRLLTPLNRFMELVSQTLNNNLTFRDHFNAEIRTVFIEPNKPIFFNHSLKSKPIGILPLKLSEDPIGAVWIDWECIGAMIKIPRVLGLDPAKKYKINILILGG